MDSCGQKLIYVVLSRVRKLENLCFLKESPINAIEKPDQQMIDMLERFRKTVKFDEDTDKIKHIRQQCILTNE